MGGRENLFVCVPHPLARQEPARLFPPPTHADGRLSLLHDSRERAARETQRQRGWEREQSARAGGGGGFSASNALAPRGALPLFQHTAPHPRGGRPRDRRVPGPPGCAPVQRLECRPAGVPAHVCVARAFFGGGGAAEGSDRAAPSSPTLERKKKEGDERKWEMRERKWETRETRDERERRKNEINNARKERKKERKIDR